MCKYSSEFRILCNVQTVNVIFFLLLFFCNFSIELFSDILLLNTQTLASIFEFFGRIQTKLTKIEHRTRSFYMLTADRKEEQS